MKTPKGPRSGFNPQTGSIPKMRPKAPVQMKEGAAAQKQIQQPPQPFANPKGSVNVPYTSQFESRGTDGPTTKGSTGTHIGAKGLPPMGPVGQKRPINQSKQIGGRMGTARGPRKVGPDIRGGGKAKRHASFYGE